MPYAYADIALNTFGENPTEPGGVVKYLSNLIYNPGSFQGRTRNDLCFIDHVRLVFDVQPEQWAGTSTFAR